MISIVLADDHPIIRQGLRTILEAEPDFRILGEASDGLEAVRLVEKIQPNILVVDLMMPGINGLEVARQIRKAAPRTRPIILSMHASEGYVMEALRIGVLAYVLKDAQSHDLVKAIREAMIGNRYLSPALSERSIELFMERAQEIVPDAYEMLTTREREVLQLAAQGNTSGEIAEKLFISSRTAEAHRANFMRKLGLNHQTDLVRFAIRRGILTLED